MRIFRRNRFSIQVGMWFIFRPRNIPTTEMLIVPTRYRIPQARKRVVHGLFSMRFGREMCRQLRVSWYALILCIALYRFALL